jgi:hypothetical protein
MRRTAFRILLAITVLAMFGLSEVAQALAPAREPVLWEPYSIPAGAVCSFQIDIGVVANNEYQTVTTLDDGTTVTKASGNLVLSFTNHTTGFTIVRNVSGPSTRFDFNDADATGTFVLEGLSFFTFGPISQENTGEPGLVFTSGRVVMQFQGNIVDSFSLTGNQVNGCELLAG